jgi:putative transposase
MNDGHTQVRRDWRIPDELWDRIEPLLPLRKPHPLGCHRPRVDDRQAMEAIFFVLRTGCPWNALPEGSLYSRGSAHRHIQEWAEAGGFLTLWMMGLADYDALHGIDWAWLVMDGAMTKASLGGKTVGKNPTDRGKTGTKRSILTDSGGVPIGLAVEGANRNDFKMTRETIETSPVKRPEPTPEKPQGMYLDKGYDDEVRELVAEFGFTAHMRA